MHERIESVTVAARGALWCVLLSLSAALVWESNVDARSDPRRAGLSSDRQFDELLNSVIEGDVAEVREALERPIDLGQQGFAGCTALGCAARSSRPGATQIAQLLVERGAPIELGDIARATPLMIALANGNQGIARRLVYAGANVNARDAAGDTPLRIALEVGNPELIQLIRDHGAR